MTSLLMALFLRAATSSGASASTSLAVFIRHLGSGGAFSHAHEDEPDDDAMLATVAVAAIPPTWSPMWICCECNPCTFTLAFHSCICCNKRVRDIDRSFWTVFSIDAAAEFTLVLKEGSDL